MEIYTCYKKFLKDKMSSTTEVCELWFVNAKTVYYLKLFYNKMKIIIKIRGCHNESRIQKKTKFKPICKNV